MALIISACLEESTILDYPCHLHPELIKTSKVLRYYRTLETGCKIINVDTYLKIQSQSNEVDSLYSIKTENNAYFTVLTWKAFERYNTGRTSAQVEAAEVSVILKYQAYIVERLYSNSTLILIQEGTGRSTCTTGPNIWVEITLNITKLVHLMTEGCQRNREVWENPTLYNNGSKQAPSIRICWICRRSESARMVWNQRCSLCLEFIRLAGYSDLYRR